MYFAGYISSQYPVIIEDMESNSQRCCASSFTKRRSGELVKNTQVGGVSTIGILTYNLMQSYGVGHLIYYYDIRNLILMLLSCL